MKTIEEIKSIEIHLDKDRGEDSYSLLTEKTNKENIYCGQPKTT